MKRILIILFYFTFQNQLNAQINTGYMYGFLAYDCDSSSTDQLYLDSLDSFLRYYYSFEESKKVRFTIGMARNQCEYENEDVGYLRAKNLIEYLRNKYPQFQGNEIYIFQTDEVFTTSLNNILPKGEIIGIIYSTVLPIDMSH